MSIGLILPAAAAVALATAAGFVRLPVRPRVAMGLLATIAATVALTVLAVVVVGSTGLLARSTPGVALVHWCPAIPFHHEVTYLEGVLAAAILAAATLRIRRVLLARRQASTDLDGRRLSVLETAEPIAFAAPGEPGCVVVSQGMLDVLSPPERQVLFAHERAHLSQKHHRYLLLAELSVAVLPLLRPLAEQLRLATERSADEAAADAVGDRRLVARTIAKAAISTNAYHGLVGAFGGSSVPMRVRALVGPAPSRVVVAAAWATFAVVAGSAMAAGSIQFHHLAELIRHLCHV